MTASEVGLIYYMYFNILPIIIRCMVLNRMVMLHTSEQRKCTAFKATVSKHKYGRKIPCNN